MPLEKQFSVFVKNKVGSLGQLCRALAKEKVNIKAVSILDDLGWGIVRVIVDDVEKAQVILQELGFMYGESQVLTACVENHPGALCRLAELLWQEEINVEQAFVTAKGKEAIVVLSTTNDKMAAKVLEMSAT